MTLSSEKRPKGRSKRVAITGIGIVTPLGHCLPEMMARLRASESSVLTLSEWDEALAARMEEVSPEQGGLSTRLVSPVLGFEDQSIPRKHRRSMSRVSALAASATAQAIEDAGLSQADLEQESTGISYGSTMGGTSAIREYLTQTVKTEGSFASIQSTTFLKIMSHTCAANIATAFSIPGRVIASCTACAASTQAIGFAYEAIKNGQLERVICGGAEELEISVVAVFDILRSTSARFNTEPKRAPRPFDTERDGIVVGEGAGTFILEDFDLAEARGAKIYGEVVGFYTNNDARHMTNPSEEGLQRCMEGALREAGLKASDIAYVNAHGTGTRIGDAAESKAIAELFGNQVPVSSLKGNFGHLMGACGVIESAAVLAMMAEERVLGTLNLQAPDADCGGLNYLRHGQSAAFAGSYVLKNSFAFGGINASLVFAKGRAR